MPRQRSASTGKANGISSYLCGHDVPVEGRLQEHELVTILISSSRAVPSSSTFIRLDIPQGMLAKKKITVMQDTPSKKCGRPLPCVEGDYKVLLIQ